MAYIEVGLVWDQYVYVKLRQLSGQPSDYKSVRITAPGWYHGGVFPTPANFFEPDGSGFIKSKEFALQGFHVGTTYDIFIEVETNKYYPVGTVKVVAGSGGVLPDFPKKPTLSKGTQTNNSAVLNISDYGTAEHFVIEGRIDGVSTWTQYSSWAYNPYTVTGLLTGRTYDFRVAGVNTTGHQGIWSDIVTFNIGTTRPSDWEWEFNISSGVNFYNQSNKNIYLMRATHWNQFTDRINLFRTYKLGAGKTYSFTQATTSTTEVGIRNCINQAIDKVNDMLTTNKIANVYSGDTIKALTFQQLRDRLNSL